MTQPAAITATLAQLIHASSIEVLPASLRHEARRSLVNWMGAALGGCRDESVDLALATLTEFSGPEHATVIGRKERLDAMNAALVNGISANILDFDDTLAHMVLHPTASIACALLALSQCRNVNGAEFLHALVVGVEVEARLLDPRVAEYKFAWSPTTTVAGMGAAAACARALRLPPTQIAWAIGIAATQASGLRETGGSMSKAFNAGQAARAGLCAALLAERGFTGAVTAIEGPNGFLAAFGTSQDLTKVLDGWGERYHLASNTYKAFPCGIVTHPAITACIDLNAKGVRPEEVDSLRLIVHPVARRLTGRTNPGGPLDAKLSVSHTSAAALVRGRVGVKEFDLACIHDPLVARIRDCTSVVVDEACAIDAATVEIVTRDGRTFREHTPHAIGSLDRPMSDQALEDKLRSLAEGVLPSDAVDALLAHLWSIDEANEAGTLALAAGRS